MPDHVAPFSQSAIIMMFTVLSLGLRPGLSMCETRCEQSIPSLYKLRTLWTRSFKRVGEQRVSFEQFLLSLVQASERDNDAMRQLRHALLRIIGRYQDCVMACEHQFSKRSRRSSSRTRRKALDSMSIASSDGKGNSKTHYPSSEPDQNFFIPPKGDRTSEVT